ncbi:MAG: hypothetical protein LBB56_08105, partial [Chitinispirillales bacterium]|nr:hypothetical protein [Chitinispirillales bacterium]
MYYSKKQLLGAEYTGKVIVLNALNTIMNSSMSATMTNGVSAGMVAGRDEWLKAADGIDVFDNIIVCNNKWSDTYYTDKNKNLTYYIPAYIAMFDGDYNGNAVQYNIVLVVDKIELRKTTYGKDSSVELKIDNSKKIWRGKTIRKMENTLLTALKVLELRGEKSAETENTDDIIISLSDKDYLAYIDWKLDYDDVCYNFNTLLKKRNIPLMEFEKDNLSLSGEDAVKYCIRQFHNEDFSFVLIDVGTDGFYVGLI